MNNQKNPPNILLFGLGLAAGWLIKQLFDSPAGQAKREELMATADTLRERLEDMDSSGRVKEIFGNVSSEATLMYQDAQEQLITELSELRLSFDELDKTKYLKIVGNVIKSAKENQKLPEAQLLKLQTALKSDFKKLQTDFQDRHSDQVDQIDKAAKTAKKTVRRANRKIVGK